MANSRLEHLPSFVAASKRETAQILEQLKGKDCVSLQNRETIVPAQDEPFPHAGEVALTSRRNE